MHLSAGAAVPLLQVPYHGEGHPRHTDRGLAEVALVPLTDALQDCNSHQQSAFFPVMLSLVVLLLRNSHQQSAFFPVMLC